MFIGRIRDQRGQGMTEYILIVALIAVAAIVAVKMFGGQVNELFSKSSEKISSETSSSLK